MGQYWLSVNLTKREFFRPHRLGGGLKLYEQASSGKVGAALVILCAAERESRGGGDFDVEVAPGVIGRWAGDRIALVGDYAERSDLPPRFNTDIIWDLCINCDPHDLKKRVSYYQERGLKNKATRLEKELANKGPYKDITDMVIEAMDRLL